MIGGQITHELVSLQWLSGGRSDRNLVRLAEMMGLQSRSLVLGSPDGEADLRQGLAPTTAGGFGVMASARSLVELSRRTGGSSEIEFLLRAAKHLFVYGFGPGPSDRSLLTLLSGGDLTSIACLEPSDNRYVINSTAREICLQLSGLAFGPTNPENDCTFSGSADTSRVHELISIGDRPFFVQTVRAECTLTLLAGREIADIDQPVEPGISPLKWFSQLAPAMMFLRYAFGRRCWHNNAPRGCFIVDDPLLKNTYGFLDFHELLGSMKRRGFATSIAFIPWNHSRTSDQSARFFRTNSDRYSLCVHGCDHTKAEFGITDSNELDHRVGLATERMEQHERRTGLPFDKVMVFPQGVFSSVALKRLKSHHYLAAVNSTLYPIDRPANELCLRDFLDIALMRYWDFPLFERHYPFDLNACAFDLFLGRPLFLVEHHQYFKNGCGPLEGFVQKIQSIDPRIVWGSLESACANSYLEKIDSSGVLHLKIYTDRVLIANRDAERRHYRVWKQEHDESAIVGVTMNGKPIDFRSEAGVILVTLHLDPGECAALRWKYGEPPPVPQKANPQFGHASKVCLRRHLCRLRDEYLSKSEFLSKLLENSRNLLK